MEADDTINNNTNRHTSTMPRQNTKKNSGGNKGRKLSQPNSNSKINPEPPKSSTLSPNRYNTQNSRKPLGGNQSTSNNNFANTKGKSNVNIIYGHTYKNITVQKY